MSVTRIANRYAKSLLELAIEQGKLEVVHDDINTVSSAVQHRDLYVMFKSPIVSSDKKVNVVDALFNDKLDKLTVSYLKLLIEKGREGFIPEIVKAFEAQYKKHKHITPIRVTSAEPLDAKTLNTIREKILSSGLTFENLDIETQVDPSLIGGFVIEFGDKRYDASIFNKLNELDFEFTKNLYIKEF